MKTKNIFFSLAALILFAIGAHAQPGQQGGQRGQRPDPTEQLTREKAALYESVDDLSDDQKVLIDGIYEEFGVTLTETLEEARGNRDREAMREQMQGLRAEKDALMKDVLSDSQYVQYEELLKSNRKNRREEQKD